APSLASRSAAVPASGYGRGRRQTPAASDGWRHGVGQSRERSEEAFVLKEFRDFAVKGNLVELTVAFILALFFTAVVQSLVNDVILPFIAALFGQPNFSSLVAHVGKGVIRYGQFIQAVI